MAKQKNQIEEIEVPIEGTNTFRGAEPDTTTNASQPEPQATTAPANTPEEGEKKPTAEVPDSYTLDVLKSFPANEWLYVDKQGGVFTADTPKPMRGNAILYKNPFYKR